MAIAVVIRNESDIRNMISWGARFALARDEPLLVLQSVEADEREAPLQIPLDQSGPTSTEEAERPDLGDVKEGAKGLARPIADAWRRVAPPIDPPPPGAPDDTVADEASDVTDVSSADATTVNSGPRPEISYFCIRGPKGADEIQPHLSSLAVDLLILPVGLLNDTPSCQLLHSAACATMVLKGGAGAANPTAPIVTPTLGCHHDHEALKWSADLAAHEGRTVRAVYVEHSQDEFSPIVAAQTAVRNVGLAMLPADAPMDPTPVVNKSVDQGIRSVADESDCELLLLGARTQRSGGKLLHSVAAKLLKWVDGPTVAVVRPAIPLHHRFLHYVETWLEDRLPQLTRDERVELVGRIRGGSQFNVDFMALICLSTLIAALGLARNQGAVVIGAMLVAPLMTPLMGFGLALMQGNRTLAAQSAKSVLGGFTLALLIGVAVGLLIVNLEPSTEMAGRGSPGVLDLLVAFVSGMAAAYAIGRPNLSSALPGVAIAAALVPPIATAGMGLAIGEFRLAGGALLLFLTNIIAIGPRRRRGPLGCGRSLAPSAWRLRKLVGLGDYGVGDRHHRFGRLRKPAGHLDRQSAPHVASRSPTNCFAIPFQGGTANRHRLAIRASRRHARRTRCRF